MGVSDTGPLGPSVQIDAADAAVVAARVPADIRALLTPAQVDQIVALMIPHPADHALAYRASTWFFGQRFYLALFSGREARSPGRIRRDGLAVTSLGFALRVVSVCAWVTFAAVGVALAGVILLYLVKSHFGIDLMDGPSMLHQYFFD